MTPHVTRRKPKQQGENQPAELIQHLLHLYIYVTHQAQRAEKSEYDVRQMLKKKKKKDPSRRASQNFVRSIRTGF